MGQGDAANKATKESFLSPKINDPSNKEGHYYAKLFNEELETTSPSPHDGGTLNKKRG